MEVPRSGGLLALMLDEEGGENSQGSLGALNLKREWMESTLRFLIDLCEEMYSEYNHKKFKKSNLESFANAVNTQFLEEPQRTW